MSLFMLNTVRTLREVGEHFKRTTRTAQRWRKAGLPRTALGYDLAECKKWLEARAYTGATFRASELQAQVDRLFDLAVEDLRRGLQHLCLAFIKARGKTRARLVDRAVREILQVTMHQASLLEREEGGARQACGDSSNLV
jgi:hypothetical protein